MVDLLEVVHKLKEGKTQNYFLNVMYIFHKYILKFWNKISAIVVSLNYRKKFQFACPYYIVIFKLDYMKVRNKA